MATARILGNAKLMTLEDLFFEQLGILHDIEARTAQVIPSILPSIYSPELRAALERHALSVNMQLLRLEQSARLAGREPERVASNGVRFMLNEVEDRMGQDEDPSVREAALIAAMQRALHYAMAAYGTARSVARRLRYEQPERLIGHSLEDLKGFDAELTRIAEEAVNPAADFSVFGGHVTREEPRREHEAPRERADEPARTARHAPQAAAPAKRKRAATRNRKARPSGKKKAQKKAAARNRQRSATRGRKRAKGC